MKKVITTLLLLTITFVYGQQPPNEFGDKLDEYFTALTNQQNFNGTVLVALNKEILLNKSYNMKSTNDSLKVTKDSRFLMASLSKLYTKYAILKLVDLGKIKLTDPLNKFIPDFPSGSKITIDHLMEQKSGLPRELAGNPNYDDLSLDKIIELAKKETLIYTPGSQSIYSNIGYFILQYIIDKNSEKGYTDFINNEIIKKMDLQNTGEFNSTQNIINFAYGFDLINNKITAASLTSINHFGTGTYYTTVGDLFNYSQQLVTGKTIPKSLALKLFWKDSLIVQSGGREGYRAYFYKNLKSRITFIFLANYTDIPFQDIADNVFKIMDKEPYKLQPKSGRVKTPQPPEILKRYTGKYMLEVDRDQFFTITLENGELYFTDGTEKTLLIPEDESIFFDNPKSRNSYIFKLNEKTKKYDFEVIAGDVKFKTIKIE